MHVALRWLSASSGSSFAGRAQRVLVEGSPAHASVEIRGPADQAPSEKWGAERLDWRRGGEKDGSPGCCFF